MKEYIEKSKAIEAIGKEPMVWNDSLNFAQEYLDWSNHKAALSAIPAADVVEVVHGKWIHLNDGDWECSNCKESFVICVCGKDRTWKHPYFPSCGAKMDLEE